MLGLDLPLIEQHGAFVVRLDQDACHVPSSGWVLAESVPSPSCTGERLGQLQATDTPPLWIQNRTRTTVRPRNGRATRARTLTQASRAATINAHDQPRPPVRVGLRVFAPGEQLHRAHARRFGDA